MPKRGEIGGKEEVRRLLCIKYAIVDPSLRLNQLLLDSMAPKRPYSSFLHNYPLSLIERHNNWHVLIELMKQVTSVLMRVGTIVALTTVVLFLIL